MGTRFHVRWTWRHQRTDGEEGRRPPLGARRRGSRVAAGQTSVGPAATHHGCRRRDRIGTAELTR
ncbi:hypothetical protein BCD48_17695 [Pseudofrankia sp. BMG5.36]|nr:hypothetical protein BCD48_17695 [Pseudofrankia sp. BMG5.36]